jgi:hypothetical protein
MFAALEEGDYQLWAQKFGYAVGGHGQRRARSRKDLPPVRLARDEHRADITLRMWKYAVITGTVVDEYGEPVIGVDVHAFARTIVAGRPQLGDEDFQDATSTDDRGRYRITSVDPGEYIVGIVRSEATAPLALAAAHDRVAQSGDDAALMQMYMDVEQGGLSVPSLGQSTHVSAGSWVFAISKPPSVLRDGRWFVYPTQFFGNSSQPSAARPVTVRAGEEVTGIDLTMRAVPSVRVSGVVTDQNGPVAGMPVRLTPVANGDFGNERSTPGAVGITDATGQFTVLGVTPGEYTLRALKGPAAAEWGLVEAIGGSDDGSVISVGREIVRAPPPPPRVPTLFATTTIAVGSADVNDVQLIVRNGVRLAGRVEFSGAADPPPSRALEHLRLVVERREGTRPSWMFDMNAKFGADGRFETSELPPGSYFLRMPNPPPGWTLESVMANGLDLSDRAIEITSKPVENVVARFTDKPSMLSGTVRAANAVRPEDALIVLFPADRSKWVDYGASPRGLCELYASSDGSFSVSAVPAGAYFVAAVQDDFLTDWRDPAFLARLTPFATRVTIDRGEHKTVTVEMGRVR